MIQKTQVSYPWLMLVSLNTQEGFYSKVKFNEFNQLITRCDIFAFKKFT